LNPLRVIENLKIREKQETAAYKLLPIYNINLSDEQEYGGDMHKKTIPEFAGMVLTLRSAD
jgi:hypothetical protein